MPISLLTIKFIFICGNLFTLVKFSRLKVVESMIPHFLLPRPSPLPLSPNFPSFKDLDRLLKLFFTGESATGLFSIDYLELRRHFRNDGITRHS